MTVRIEFFKDEQEPVLPIIKLTKSRNKTTGTATFIFLRPQTFFSSKNVLRTLKQMSLFWNNRHLITTDISIFFYKGKPFLIKSIFLFKNSKEWFNFLNFMVYFSKETGLSFTEINK